MAQKGNNTTLSIGLKSYNFSLAIEEFTLFIKQVPIDKVIFIALPAVKIEKYI